MVVLLPNAQLGVCRALPERADAHGYPVPDGWAPLADVGPGRVQDLGDGVSGLYLDPASWPVRVGDLVGEPDAGGRRWLVLSVHQAVHSRTPVADYVATQGRLRDEDGNTITHLEGPADG